MTDLYLTGNPVPSNSPFDLSDNAQGLDVAMVAQQPNWTDRLGIQRLSLYGAEQMWLQLVQNSGYEPVHLTYVDGVPLVVQRPSQLIDRLGIAYRVKLPVAGGFPLTLSGNWVTDAPLLLEATDSVLRQDLAAPTGAGLVGYRLGASGNPRTVALKLATIVSVDDHKVPGDSDPVAIQKAVDYLASLGGGRLVFEARDYNMGAATVTLPAANLLLEGYGPATRLIGTGNMIKYPDSVRDGGGNVVLQDITRLTFIQNGDNASIQLHQTWDGAGKLGPSIYDNTFINTNTTATNASCISVQGIWAGRISDNRFVGVSNGTFYIGYAVRVVLTANMTSSVMNLVIEGNTVVAMGHTFYSPPRTGAGRTEGIKIIGNNMVAGFHAIKTNAVLALTITGNQISDFIKCYESTADFDVTVSGNSEMTASDSVINILADPNGFAERYTITGNTLGSFDAAVSLIRLTNVVGLSRIRNISIVGNVMKAVAGTSKGVSFEGNFADRAVAIVGNSFSNLNWAEYFSAVAHADVVITGNTYGDGVVNRIFDPLGTISRNDDTWATTVVQSLAGGSPTGTVTIPVPAGVFFTKPVDANLTAVTDLIQGFYDYDNSTVTSLFFQVRTAAGGNITAGAHRLTVSARGLR